jgi:hypothetical protein
MVLNFSRRGNRIYGGFLCAFFGAVLGGTALASAVGAA